MPALLRARRRPRRGVATVRTGAVLASAVLALASCTSTSGAGDDAGRTLTVFAAASLQDSFEQLGEQFEQEHPGVEVRFSFAGSSDLVTQISQGAPADVIATANTATMDQLSAQDLLAGDPTAFATNTLTIAVVEGNPAGITGLEDLLAEDLDVVLCAPQVPCGAASETVEDAAGLQLSPVSEEQSVTEVLNKVAAGQADAGLVYTTDIARQGDAVDAVDFAEAADAVNTYPIAPLADAPQQDLGREFTELVLRDEGRAVLGEDGFGAP